MRVAAVENKTNFLAMTLHEQKELEQHGSHCSPQRRCLKPTSWIHPSLTFSGSYISNVREMQRNLSEWNAVCSGTYKNDCSVHYKTLYGIRVLQLLHGTIYLISANTMGPYLSESVQNRARNHSITAYPLQQGCAICFPFRKSIEFPEYYYSRQGVWKYFSNAFGDHFLVGIVSSASVRRLLSIYRICLCKKNYQ
jgi:hypothetical protein